MGPKTKKNQINLPGAKNDTRERLFKKKIENLCRVPNNGVAPDKG